MPTPAQSIAAAIAAYSKSARGETPALQPQDARPADDFAKLVRGAVDTAIGVGEASERQALAAVAGKADIDQVVTAVAEAELTLETVVAVRDKVLEAYQEILRMPM